MTLLCISTIVGISLGIGNNSVSALSITLSIPDNINLNVDPNRDNGFAESSSSVSVSTDNFMGYTLSIKAKDSANGNSLVNTKDSNSKLSSIGQTLTPDQYKNGSDGETYVNTWGFKPSSLNNSPNTNYMPGPDSSTDITLARTDDSSSGSENFSLAIAAKVDENTTAGNYQNTFILTAAANEATYTISFDTNGGSGGPGKPQTGNIGDDTDVTIDSTIPTNSNGKDFLGWCTKTPDEDGYCPGAVVQPGGEFPLCKCDLNLTLTAMWGKSYSPRKYTINYHSDIGEPTGMPETQTGTLEYPNYDATLSDNTPALNLDNHNYAFIGWCTSNNITNNGVSGKTPTCNGTTYQPGNTVTVAFNGQTLNLYTMWRYEFNDGDTCSRSGYTDTSKYYGGLCWMWTDYKTNRTWGQANSDCPTGWHLPSQSEFQALLNAIGTGRQLYSAGWSNLYWSSTPYGGAGGAYNLYVTSSEARIDHFGNINSDFSVRCVAH